MAFTLVQAGSSLRSVNPTGGFSDALSLPDGVTLATNRVPRFAKFKRYVIVVNTPARPLSVDVNGVVRLLTPAAPTAAVVLTGPNAGTLTGSYKALQTYRLLDTNGNVIAESDYGPAMSAYTAIAAKKLIATFAVSPDTVDVTMLYRTATLGSTYFPWAQVNGNTSTTEENDDADEDLGTVEGLSLGTAPNDLYLIAEWGGRAFGVSRANPDDLRWTEAGTMYAWSALNTLPIQHVGADEAGVTAFIPRRDALGVARRDMFLQVTGSQRTNFRAVTVPGGEQTGCVSQESVIVFNDVAYFLWRDGVYKWDSNGITCITDGAVRSWFTTDDHFNRAMFWRAFAQLEPRTLKYRLFLASAGSPVHDRWIEYDLITKTWWGPHKTDAFTPTSAVMVAGANQQPFMMIGSAEGFLSQDQSAKNDWTATGIAIDLKTQSFDMGEPDKEKYFGELSVNAKVQTAGSVTITPAVGAEDQETAGAPFTLDETNGRQRLGRIGIGRSATLEITHDTVNEDVVIYGLEIDPVHRVGRR